MQRAHAKLAEHDVNQARRKQGRPPVTDIWLWGQGRPTKLEPFAARSGLNGAVITGVDIIRGLAVLMGMDLIEVAGATGYIDTNYKGKGAAALEALERHDVVVVHVEAPDEAGHLGDAKEKIRALEQIDATIVGPLLDAARRLDAWKVLVAPDHPTPVTTKAHSAVPPPFCFAGSDIQPVERQTFSESTAQAGPLIDPGHQLMQFFLNTGDNAIT
jgi:2,3-bisphosphoglycerate-independent phosphoglycerate mutase